MHDLAFIFQNFCRDICITCISFENETDLARKWNYEMGATGFLVTHPKRCQNIVLKEGRTDFKSILPHIILSSEGQQLTCWVCSLLFFFVIHHCTNNVRRLGLVRAVCPPSLPRVGRWLVLTFTLPTQM